MWAGYLICTLMLLSTTLCNGVVFGLDRLSGYDASVPCCKALKNGARCIAGNKRVSTCRQGLYCFRYNSRKGFCRTRNWYERKGKKKNIDAAATGCNANCGGNDSSPPNRPSPPSDSLARCGQTVLDEDFNSYRGKKQKFSKAIAQKLFGSQLRGGAGWHNGEIGEGHLQVFQKKGCIGYSQCGVQMKIKLKKTSMKQATFSYRLKFSKDYHWTNGGKLPGVCSEPCPTGCTPVRNDYGWSSRVMWRQNGALMSYMYYKGKDSRERCGENWHYEDRARTDQWISIRVFNKINEKGKENGVHRVWVNGRETYNRHSTELADESDHYIKTFTFQTFHGGRSDNFKPNKNQYLFFDDLKVQEGYCPP